MTDATSEPPLIAEAADIDYVEEDQRYGHPRNQFTIRCAPVLYLAPIFLGGAAIPTGLGLTGTITAIICGNVLGAIGAALCAAMGPKRGMPQLVMSRASFGYRGNYLPAILATILFLGYSGVGTTVGAKALSTLFSAPFIPVAIAVGILSVILAIFGYDLLHLSGRWVTGAGTILLIVLTAFSVVHGAGTTATPTAKGGAYWTAWLLEFTVVFSFTVSWMIYASDYSRYLPKKTNMWQTWGYAFWGLVIGSCWTMILGALLATIVPNGDVLQAMKVVLPLGLLWVILIVLTITSVTHNAVNLYSCSMSARTWDIPTTRRVAVALAGIIAIILAIVLGKTSFQAHFNAFLIVMSYFMLPWLALRLIEFFWREPRIQAPVEAYYRKDGPWRGVNWRGMVAFLVGLGISIPFMSSEIWEGPIAHQLGGADISYFVGFIVTGVIYAVLAHNVRPLEGSVMGEHTPPVVAAGPAT